MTALLGWVLHIVLAPAASQAKVNTDTIVVNWNQFACGWYVGGNTWDTRTESKLGWDLVQSENTACAAQNFTFAKNKKCCQLYEDLSHVEGVSFAAAAGKAPKQDFTKKWSFVSRLSST